MAEETKDDEAIEDYVRHLQEKYVDPRLWALDISLCFKQLAVNMTKIAPVEGDGSIDTFKGLVKLLKQLSTDRDLNDIVADGAAKSRKQGMDVNLTSPGDEVNEVNDEAPVEAQDVEADLFSFETNSAYTVRITEDTPTSALSSLTLNGNGPATVTIRVQKKTDATATPNSKSDVIQEHTEWA